jgi:hypothetical protein
VLDILDSWCTPKRFFQDISASGCEDETAGSEGRFKRGTAAKIAFGRDGVIGDNFQPLPILVIALASPPNSGSEGNVRLLSMDSKIGIRGT